MDHNTQNTFSEVVNALKLHPLLSCILSIVGVVYATAAPVAATHFEYPVWVMQTGQLLLWVCAYTTTAITVLGALEKYCGIKVKFDLSKLKRLLIRKK